MDSFLGSLISGFVSGSIISTVIGFLLHRRTTRIEEEIRNHYEKSMAVFQSTRSWKERSVSELLGPVFMQLHRSKRAFLRWQNQNLYLEAKVIGEANRSIRDLLLTKGHLIPPELLEDAGKLTEHYDVWLEEFERIRSGIKPDSETSFVFVGPKGYPFPVESELRFQEKFTKMWSELYQREID